jgi:tRNA (cmo5U34)-methyltransferase
LSLELIACAAAATNRNARSVLDVGCGAGNYVLKLLEKRPNLDVMLLDLSQPMLQRAFQRVTQATRGAIQIIQGDIRGAQLGLAQFDVVVAAAVLHHLRAGDEWRGGFAKLYDALTPGGAV